MSETLTGADLLRMSREECRRLEAKYDEALRIQRVLGAAVYAIARGEAVDPRARAIAAYRECWPETKDVPEPKP